MTINERQFGRTVVLDVRGPIAGTTAAASVTDVLKRLARRGTPTVIADLAGVPVIDLSGLGALVEGSRAIRAGDGTMTLAGVTRRLNDLIVITRLLTMFDTFESVEDAMAAFGIVAEPVPVPSAAALGAVSRFLRRA